MQPKTFLILAAFFSYLVNAAPVSGGAGKRTADVGQPLESYADNEGDYKGNKGSYKSNSKKRDIAAADDTQLEYDNNLIYVNNKEKEERDVVGEDDAQMEYDNNLIYVNNKEKEERDVIRPV